MRTISSSVRRVCKMHEHALRFHAAVLRVAPMLFPVCLFFPIGSVQGNKMHLFDAGIREKVPFRASYEAEHDALSVLLATLIGLSSMFMERATTLQTMEYRSRRWWVRALMLSTTIICIMATVWVPSIANAGLVEGPSYNSTIKIKVASFVDLFTYAVIVVSVAAKITAAICFSKMQMVAHD